MDINTLKLYIESQINATNKELKTTTTQPKAGNLKGKLEAYKDIYNQIIAKPKKNTPKKNTPTSYDIEGALSLISIYQSDVKTEVLQYITSNIIDICIMDGEELKKVGEASGYLGENITLLFKGTVDAFIDKDTLNALTPHLLYEDGIIKILLNSDMAEAQVRVK